MCVRLFIAVHVVLDRRNSGVREPHQWSMSKAHESERDRDNDAEQCGSALVQVHESLCSHGLLGCQPQYKPDVT